MPEGNPQGGELWVSVDQNPLRPESIWIDHIDDEGNVWTTYIPMRLRRLLSIYKYQRQQRDFWDLLMEDTNA